METICAVAILADEDKFIDEWLVYHRIIGIDHFFLYDDDPSLPLANHLKPHSEYVTIIPWYGRNNYFIGRNRQTKAYTHWLQNFSFHYDWVTFIDGDEFIVLREHKLLQDFLIEFNKFTSVSLHWHVFGHNGFFDDPDGLITDQLIRRKADPSVHTKSITRSTFIKEINSAHLCRELNGKRADANKILYNEIMYAGKTRRAHINHYQCRSFVRWMSRVKRGCVTIQFENDVSEENKWRVDEQECLKKFVTTVALDKNEVVDDYMRKYSAEINQKLAMMR